jgi:hypothetical protein
VPPGNMAYFCADLLAATGLFMVLSSADSRSSSGPIITRLEETRNRFSNCRFPVSSFSSGTDRSTDSERIVGKPYLTGLGKVVRDSGATEIPHSRP